jgi:DNA-binding transcriptional LysR family regulator
MLEDIEVFCAVAKHKSFSKTALALHISTSIATRRLARLEKKLDVSLFHRTTRQVTLTEAGRLYFDEVKNLMDGLEAANQNVKSIRKEISGVIKVGVPVSISHMYVTEHLHEFVKRYPKLRVHLVTGNHLLDLLENGFDVVMHCGELPSSSLHYKKLGMWDKVTCASPRYLQEHGTPMTPEDLAQHNCLDHADTFHVTWSFQDKGKTKEIAVSGNACVNSSIDLVNLAVNDMGIGVSVNGDRF